MNKQDYQKPAMRVVELQHQSHLLAGSVKNVDGGDTGISIGGGSGGSAKARSFDDWDGE